MNGRLLSTASKDLRALRELREEMDLIYSVVKQTQLAVLTLARSIEQLRGCDEGTHDMVRELQEAMRPSAGKPPAPLHCASCGSHLDHHRAEAGEFLICPTCGWSDFVAADGERPMQPPYAAAEKAVSAPASGWV